MRGLSLRALAEKMEGRVSYNALHKYEQGLMMPDSRVLTAIADALDQDLDFFFREPAVELREVRFRKTSRLGAKEEQAIREQATDYFERCREIDQIVGIPVGFQNPLAGFRIRKPEDVETAADQVRARWILGEDPLPNVREMLESKGVLIFEVETPESFNGFAGHADGQPMIVLGAWLNRDLPRKRFTELHEIGHILVEFEKGLSEKDQERLCHRFAGAMLIPKNVFIQEFGGVRQRVSIEELVDLKERYGISIAAIMHRAFDLELISGALYERFCINYKKQRWHKGEPGEYSGREISSRFEQLVLRATSEGMVSQTKGAALLNEPLVDFRERLVGIE
jgi:Zn-dependent peptidase ImmA (M78 family)